MSRASRTGGRSFPGERYPIVLVCVLIIYLTLSPDTALAFVGLPWLGYGLTMRIAPEVNDVELGQPFTVNVMVDDAVDLGAFQFDMTYDPTVAAVIQVELGPFLGSTGRTAQPVGPSIDNAAGTVTFAAFSFGDSAGPEGTGSLATITFRAVGSGTSALNLQDVVVTDTMANVQSASAEGGTVTVVAPVPTSTPTVTPSPRATPAAAATPTSTTAATEATRPAATDAARATATSGADVTPTISSSGTEAATPTDTTAQTPTGTLASTPVETPQPQATVASTPSPTPGVIPSWMFTPTPQLPTGPLETSAAAELPPASPVSSPSLVAALSNPLCWLSVAGIFLLIGGCIFYILLRRYRG